MPKQINIPENELILMLQQHDRKGFEYLYDRYSAALYGVVVRIVRSEELAEDVVQEAFVKIWKYIGQYEKSKGTLFTWILNIARNTAIDKTRSQDYRQQSQIQDMEQNVHIVDQKSKVEQEVDHIGLEKIMPLLKPEHRLVVEYLYFRGYTQSELSKELDIPLGTVKTRIKMAISHLREMLDVKIDL